MDDYLHGRADKLAVLSSHPIQYQAPLFRELAKRLDLRVFLGSIPTRAKQGEGFAKPFEWDLPLREGYHSEVLSPEASSADGIFQLTGMFSCLNSTWKSWRPDAAIIWGWHKWSLRAGLLAARKLRVPALFRGENNNFVERPPLTRFLHRFVLMQFSGYLSIGSANRRYYESLKVPVDRIFHAPYASDTVRISEAINRACRDEARKRWGIPNDATCFLFCGKLQAKKHPLDAMAAVERVPGSWLLVAGSGELDPFIPAKQPRLSKVGFLNLSEISQAYAAADALILPSDARETWGLVVNEAMACRLPAVVGDQVGCCEDLIIHGQTGFSFPCGDINALAHWVRWLVEHPKEREEMGAKAKTHVDQNFAISKTVDGILQALRAVKQHPDRNGSGQAGGDRAQ